MVVNDNAYGLVERGAPIASKPAPTGIALTVFLTIFEAEKKGSSRNPGKDRNKNADLIDDVRASKHI